MARIISNIVTYKKTVVSSSREDTLLIAKKFAKNLTKDSIVAFYGDLGAGKTVFIKGIIQSLTTLPEEKITSPTFVYLHTYEGTHTFHHFDLYRLNSPQQFIDMGLDEYFDNEGICLIEWAEKIQTLLPKKSYHIELLSLTPNKRQITFSIL